MLKQSRKRAKQGKKENYRATLATLRISIELFICAEKEKTLLKQLNEYTESTTPAVRLSKEEPMPKAKVPKKHRTR